MTSLLLWGFYKVISFVWSVISSHKVTVVYIRGHFTMGLILTLLYFANLFPQLLQSGVTPILAHSTQVMMLSWHITRGIYLPVLLSVSGHPCLSNPPKQGGITLIPSTISLSLAHFQCLVTICWWGKNQQLDFEILFLYSFFIMFDNERPVTLCTSTFVRLCDYPNTQLYV